MSTEAGQQEAPVPTPKVLTFTMFEVKKTANMVKFEVKDGLERPLNFYMEKTDVATLFPDQTSNRAITLAVTRAAGREGVGPGD